MFSPFRRCLGFAATIATSATLVFGSGALASAEWCVLDPAAVIDGHYISVTITPHVATADVSKITGAQTRFVVASTVSAAPVSLAPGIFPSTETFGAVGKSGTKNVTVRATTLVTAPELNVVTDLHVVVYKGATNSGPIATDTMFHGKTNRPIEYTIHLTNTDSKK